MVEERKEEKPTPPKMTTQTKTQKVELPRHPPNPATRYATMTAPPKPNRDNIV